MRLPTSENVGLRPGRRDFYRDGVCGYEHEPLDLRVALIT